MGREVELVHLPHFPASKFSDYAGRSFDKLDVKRSGLHRGPLLDPWWVLLVSLVMKRTSQHSHLSLGLCFVVGALAACAGDVAPPGADDSEVPPMRAPGDDPGLLWAPACEVIDQPLQKLSGQQYANTVHDLLERFGLEFAGEGVDAALQALPPDSARPFAGMDLRQGRNHLQVYHAVASAVADAIAEAVAARLSAVAGNCAASLDKTVEPACVRDFVRRFGLVALRRPLNDQELSGFAKAGDDATNRSAIADAAFRLLMTPDFLYHVETEGTEVGARLALSDYALASRLSYFFWQSPPDDELLAAAAAGLLHDEDGYRAAVERVFGHARTRATVDALFRQWFALDKFPGFPRREPFLSFAVGIDTGDGEMGVHRAMVAELTELFSRILWDTPGRMADLITTTQAASSNPALNQLYGRNAKGEFPAGTRSGILTRAALLVSGDETTSPFHRGSFIRSEILCDDLISPDPAALPADALAPPPQDPRLTTRERFTLKTASPACMGCHHYINDLGYALENYDALGRFRREETIFDARGQVVTTLAIDARTVPRIEADDETQINGPIALSQALAASGKAELCFARHVARFALRRMEGDEDRCLVGGILRAVLRNGGNLADGLRAVALDPGFRTRRLSP